MQRWLILFYFSIRKGTMKIFHFEILKKNVYKIYINNEKMKFFKIINFG